MATKEERATRVRLEKYFALCDAHLDALNAIKRGDPPAARRALRKLSTACKRMAEFWQKQAERLSARGGLSDG